MGMGDRRDHIVSTSTILYVVGSLIRRSQSAGSIHGGKNRREYNRYGIDHPVVPRSKGMRGFSKILYWRKYAIRLGRSLQGVLERSTSGSEVPHGR